MHQGVWMKLKHKTPLNMLVSILPLLFALLLLQGTISRALTYQEAQALGDPNLIQYDQGAFSIGFHAAMACVVAFGTLLSIVTMLAIIVKQLILVGRINPRRTR